MAQLRECIKQGASRLTDDHYAIQFDVNVTEGGDVGMVKIKDSIIGDREIESCMVRALEGMSLPLSIRATRSSPPVSGGMAAESRALMSNVGVLGAASSLLPIVIVVAGVTILAIVTVYGVDEVTEAIKRVRKSKVEKRCAELLEECLEYRKQPEWNRDTYGDWKACESCVGICKRENGEWPHDKCPRPGSRPGDRWN